jgi:putative transposase
MYQATRLSGSRCRHALHARRSLSSPGQSKIERWHQTLKSRILLETTICLTISTRATVASSSTTIIGATMKADVYFGRGQTILLQREKTKRETIKPRRLMHPAQGLLS